MPPKKAAVKVEIENINATAYVDPNARGRGANKWMDGWVDGVKVKHRGSMRDA